MAFVDAVFHESDATFAIVDRRDAPGGHWNDAYPYVSLHQPASCYGVASRPLGTGRLARPATTEAWSRSQAEST